MSKPENSSDSQLPIGKFLIIFATLLVIVAFSAAIYGENSKIDDSSRRWMNNVSEGKYDTAYELLSQNAKSKMSDNEFKAEAAILRKYLRARYGVRFLDDYKFLSRKEFWIPWLTNNTFPVSVGLFEKKPGVRAEIKELLSTPPLAGPELKDLLIMTREKGQWKVDGLNFDPSEHADILNKIFGQELDIFASTENGFNLEGFVYDRRTTSPQDRDLLMEDLKQALRQLEKDAGIKEKPSDDLFNMIP